MAKNAEKNPVQTTGISATVLLFATVNCMLTNDAHIKQKATPTRSVVGVEQIYAPAIL